MKLLRIVLSAALLLTASIALAQTRQGDLVADIPFAFVVAGRTLPPGHYIVSKLNDNLAIQDRHNHTVFVPAHPAQRPENQSASKLVFHCYGDTHFLSEVWVGSNSIGRALFPSRVERKLAESSKEKEIAVVRIEK